MNEMIERVATDMERGLKNWNDGYLDFMDRQVFVFLARAAIEAMLEPTNEMVSEGKYTCDFSNHAAHTWRTMIEAALKEVA